MYSKMIVLGALVGGIVGWYFADPTHIVGNIVFGVMGGTLLAGWVANRATN